jgi:uncharacterized metal-binding protein
MKYPTCSKCSIRYCREKEFFKKEELPDFCPMKYPESQVLIEKSRNEAKNKKNSEKFAASVLVEKEAYEIVRGKKIPVRPRIKELIELAKKWKAKKIGIAFCNGLRKEALRLTKILESNDFEIYSVNCKCGHSDKTQLGVPKEYKMEDINQFEASCNPILQAYLLNQAKTDINVIVGLCIGHDMFFNKYSEAPVTTLIVKDRYLGHNPYAGLYSDYTDRFYDKEYH